MDLRYFDWLKKAAADKADAARYAWVPACGGAEKPFLRHGVRYLYMWNSISGDHAYYNMDGDMFEEGLDFMA